MIRRSIFSRIGSFAKARDGIAAVEFAVGAPMMLFALIIMTDLGLAIHQRMNLDQAVRAGAEFAMNEVGEVDDLKKLMMGAATGYYSDNPDDWDAQNITPPNVTKTIKWCECPDSPGTVVPCNSTICSNQLPASVYYKLVAESTYKAILLPDIMLYTDIRVQVR